MNRCFPVRVGLLAAGFATAGCASNFTGSTSGAPSAVLFAVDLSGSCALETASGAEPDEKTVWTPADLSNRRLQAEPGTFAFVKAGGGETKFPVLRTAEGTWIRRAGGAGEGGPLACSVDSTKVEALATPMRATTVRLRPAAETCRGLHPLVGSVEDVTFEPYAVLGRRLYRVKGGVEAGVTLQGAQGATLVTVPNDEFNACFASTSRAPLPEARTEALFGWLRRETHEAAPVPTDVPFEDALIALGIEESSCLREGQGPTLHRECRSSAIGISKGGSDPGAGLHFVRERLVESLQGRGDQILAPEDSIMANIVVMPPRGAYGLAKSLDSALSAAVADPMRQHRRALLGYRLLRASDASTAIVPTANIETEIGLVAGELQTATENRPVKRAAANASVPNPQYLHESARVARAQAALDDATAESRFTAALSVAAPPCAQGGGLICDVADAQRVSDAPRAWVQARTNALAVARDALAKTPPTIAGESSDTVDATVKAFRRGGEAKLKVNIVSREAGASVLASDVTMVPYAAISLDIPADAAHAVEARHGGPPTEDDVDRAAAEAIVDRMDEIVATWMSRSVSHVDPGALDPGTRAYQALLARHVAGNRRVKVFSDVLDGRSEVLAGEQTQYPVQIPPGSERKCFTFVAASGDTTQVDLNLVLTAPSGVLVGRDKRLAATAGIEVCGLAEGAYKASVSWGAPKPKAIFLSVFESTPGAVTDADLQAASSGMPPTLGKPPAAPVPAATPPVPPPPAPANPPKASAVPPAAPKAAAVNP